MRRKEDENKDLLYLERSKTLLIIAIELDRAYVDLKKRVAEANWKFLDKKILMAPWQFCYKRLINTGSNRLRQDA